MPDLVIRVGANDEALLRRMYGTNSGPPAARTPHRLVVDAHVAQRTQEIGLTARTAGVPFLVDPQTYYLQDVQHAADPWARLPFANPGALTPHDFTSQAAQDRLVEQVIEYQVTNGATAVIAPYVHIERVSNGWLNVQAGLWRRTRACLDQQNVGLPVIGLLAVGWRCLHPTQGIAKQGPVWAALKNLEPSEVALAASKVHLGANADERLVELLTLVEDLGADYPVLMWQQGLFGEACVVAGASGYETGIGYREKCDLNATMSSHRAAPAGPPGAPPVYVESLGRSIPKRTLKQIRTNRRLWSRVLCMDSNCCAPGGAGLLGDARAHVVVARARSLANLATIHQTQWKWNHLADKAAEGLSIAGRINLLADASSVMSKIDTTALRAIYDVASGRRQRKLTRRTA
jgi:hypothetical protein